MADERSVTLTKGELLSDIGLVILARRLDKESNRCIEVRKASARVLGRSVMVLRRSRAVQERREMLWDMPGVLNGWLACLGELGMSADHPAWSATKPLVAYSDLPESYLPILLPGFDEDEYANRSVKDDESDGGTDVEDVEATKELEARAKCSPRFG
ncbi:hypothetical protein Acr_04g0005970 [Actinidia rufa]|uniref:Uncharacterized protein n=1 Tax=Actinidia rufa TaxID=165716 RepID=A0A7J0EIW3_9ERIC|nr:hypothetical protein Acr_04g0005970 [Actinidia rufa]